MEHLNLKPQKMASNPLPAKLWCQNRSAKKHPFTFCCPSESDLLATVDTILSVDIHDVVASLGLTMRS